MNPAASFRIAAVQAAPVFLDREATVDKACERIAEAGREGARLIAFPEAFVPAYPDWTWLLPPGDRKERDALYAELLANSVSVPDASTERLGRAARDAGAWVVIGINERNRERGGATLYNSLLFFDDQGAIVRCHRKLVPTGGERLVHGAGDGSTLGAHATPFGRVSGLVCWENYMPLARQALYQDGTQIHVAATWDRGEPWTSTLRHVAKEGRVVVIGCCQAVHRDDIPDRYAFKQRYPADRAWINPGDSAIVDPDGKFLAGPLHEQEGILYAEIDPARLTGPRWTLDVSGHYARPDVVELVVHRGAGAAHVEPGRGPTGPLDRRLRNVNDCQ